MSQNLSFTAPRFEIGDLEKEVNNLSFEAKKSAFDDLYGKNDSTIETKEMLGSCLTEMQTGLEDIPANKKQSFLRAVERCPDHVNDVSFRLQFIRAERYNPTKAAIRFVKYWKAKEFCFGPDKTFHPLTQDDLSDEDLVSVKNFGFAIVPNRDEAGRAIITSCRRKYVFKDRKNVLRSLFYVYGCALEDVSVQRRGFVAVVIDDGAYDVAKADRKLDRLMVEYTNEAWPIKVMGIHMCFDSKFLEIILPFTLYLMGSEMRARVRLHPRSRKSRRLEDFLEYGIKAECIPKFMGGELFFEPEEFLAHRRIVEKKRREGEEEEETKEN